MAATPALPSVPCAAAPSHPAIRTPFDPTTDAMVAVLREPLAGASDFDADQALGAMRRLRDPALKPLFAQLAVAERPVLRRNGILGLAELATPARLDLLLVKTIPDAHFQAVILGEALRQNLLNREQLADIVKWPGVDDPLRLLVLGALHQPEPGQPPRPIDPEQVRPLLASDKLATAVFASLLLIELGQPQGTDEPLQRVLALDHDARTQALAIVLQQIRDKRLGAARPFLRRLFDASADDPLMRFQALYALLCSAPADPDTLSLWRAEYDRQADTGSRLRMAMAALDAAFLTRLPTAAPPVAPTPAAPADGSGAPPAAPAPASPPPARLPAVVFDPMSAESDRLLVLIAEAGRWTVSDHPADAGVQPIVALVGEAHVPTIRWALRLASTLAPAQASDIRLAVIRAAGAQAKAQPALYDLVAAAVAAQADADPTPLVAPLIGAADAGDERLTRALLAGALLSTNSAVAVLGLDRPYPSPLCDAMALLLRSRAANPAPPLKPGDLTALAKGRGSLPQPLRVEAAWRALGAADQQRVALARLMADLPAR